jgi:hypothetical protein
LPEKLTVGAPAPQPVTDGMIASDTIIRKKRAARKDLAGIRSESTTIKNNSSSGQIQHSLEKSMSEIKNVFILILCLPVTTTCSESLFSRRRNLVNRTLPIPKGCKKRDYQS